MSSGEGDTIAAVITAPGMGAMGALRLSGPRAIEAANELFRRKNGKTTEVLAGYSLVYGGVYVDGAFLDQALMLTMRAPHSFTGEDVAELQCHGGPVLLSRIQEALVSLPGLDVRPAEPGEFSLRAFLRGKMDLSRAEAIMELVAASNPDAAKLAADQVDGSLYRQLHALGDGILTLLAEMEAEVDFPDEGLGRPGGATARAEEARRLLAEAENLWASAERGRVYRDGIRVALYGRPNTGKSSILNGLLRAPRAIVTPEPGTTRDILEERVLLGGLPLVLTDTAGIRQADSEAERAGVDRARAVADGADLVLYVTELPAGITPADVAFLRELDREKTIIVFNKMDLLQPAVPMNVETDQGDDPMGPEASGEFSAWLSCRICALAPESPDTLAEAIKAFFSVSETHRRREGLILNRRQRDALLQAKQALAAAVDALQGRVPEDIAAIDLRQAWTYIGELTGESLQPALVDRIFSTFCLGK